jgi:hypothetical protein
MPDQQGSGKHPHKSTEEPYPHHETGRSSEENRGGNQSGSQNTRGSGGNESRDLKEREYKDEHGNVHHHTHTFEEQHNK